MRRSVMIPLLLLPLTMARAELVALEDQGLDTVSGQAGLTLSSIDWTLNYDKSTNSRRGCTGSSPQLCNSIPVQLDGSNRWLVMYNAVGWVHANRIELNLVKTPTSVYDNDGNSGNDQQVSALRVAFPDAVDLDYKNWRIDKISVASTPDLTTAAYNENGKIIHFETNAKWSFGPNTTAYFFKTP